MHKGTYVRYLLIILLLFSANASARQLEASKDYELSHILGTMKVLYENKKLPFIRVIESAESIDECGGTYQSCPNFRLFIIVSLGDLGDPPSLYELPKSKGWKLEKVNENNDETVLTLVTTLDQSNIDIESRNKWKSKTYKIRVAEEGALYMEN